MVVRLESRVYGHRLALWVGRTLARLGISQATCLKVAARLMVVRVRAVDKDGASVTSWEWLKAHSR